MTYGVISFITNWVEMCMDVFEDFSEEGLCIIQGYVFCREYCH